MWTSNIAAAIIIMVYPRQISSYNTNRQIVLVKDNTCDYYENPLFQPNFLQSRIKQVEPAPVILVENRIRKESPYYQVFRKAEPAAESSKYGTKVPVSFFPNINPINMVHFDKSDLLQSQEDHKEDEEEEEINVNYDKLWKVGEIPASRSIQALPDVYVKPDDAPPIVDMMSMEKSELTEESHDLGNVEIEEKYLSDPVSKTKEIFIEKVTARREPSSTENPALAMFREIDLSKMKEETIKNSQENQQKEVTKEIDHSMESTSTIIPET